MELEENFFYRPKTARDHFRGYDLTLLPDELTEVQIKSGNHVREAIAVCFAGETLELRKGPGAKVCLIPPTPKTEEFPIDREDTLPELRTLVELDPRLEQFISRISEALETLKQDERQVRAFVMGRKTFSLKFLITEFENIDFCIEEKPYEDSHQANAMENRKKWLETFFEVVAEGMGNQFLNQSLKSTLTPLPILGTTMKLNWNIRRGAISMELSMIPQTFPESLTFEPVQRGKRNVLKIMSSLPTLEPKEIRKLSENQLEQALEEVEALREVVFLWAKNGKALFEVEGLLPYWIGRNWHQMDFREEDQAKDEGELSSCKNALQTLDRKLWSLHKTLTAQKKVEHREVTLKPRHALGPVQCTSSTLQEMERNGMISREIVRDGMHFFVGPVSNGGIPCCLIFVLKGDTLLVREAYHSRSHMRWRMDTAAYRFEYNRSKGRFFYRGEAVPFLELEHAICEARTAAENVPGELRPSSSYWHLDWEDLRNNTYDTEIRRGAPIPDISNEEFHPGYLNTAGWRDQTVITSSEVSAKLESYFPEDFTPDFSGPPHDTYVRDGIKFAKIPRYTVEEYRHNYRGKLLRFCVAHEATGRVWFDRIEPVRGHVNSFGVRRVAHNFGPLSFKPFEYRGDCHGLPSSLLKLVPEDLENKYFDITPLLDLTPHVQRFREQRGIRRNAD